MENLIKILVRIAGILLFCLFLNSCGNGFKLPKAGDARSMPVEGQERARKNVEEGSGWALKDITKGGRKTTYEFSTSNPLWRATFDVIDFMPLVTVDYSGGMIITDWYTDANTTDEALKFTIRFLSNEIRSDALDITIFKKECNLNNNCKTSKIENTLNNEIKMSILKRAAQLSKENEEKKIN